MINAKSALAHDTLWNTSYPDLSSAMAALAKQLDQPADNAAAGRPQAAWDALFMQRVARPVLFLGQSLVCLPTSEGDQTPTALKMILAFGADGKLDPVGADLTRIMNHFMQTILLGLPGTTGSPPR